MSLNVLKLMLVMGMIGHAINMYCDRILSIFPNGTISFQNIKDIGKGDMAAKIMDGVSEKVPMRSAVWGAFALFLDFLDIRHLPFTRMNRHMFMASSCFHLRLLEHCILQQLQPCWYG